MRDADNAPVAAEVRAWLKGTRNKRRVARLAGISKSMLYALLCETHPVPAWVPSRLFLVVPDLDALARTLGLHELGLKLVSTKVAASVRGVRDELLDVVEALGDLTKEVKRALLDDELSDEDRRRIRARLRAVIHEAEEMEQALDKPTTLRAVRR